MTRYLILASLIGCESVAPPLALDLHFPKDLHHFDRNPGIDGAHCESSTSGWTMELEWSTPVTDFYSCWIRSQHPLRLAEDTESATLELHYQLRNHRSETPDDYAQIMVTLSTADHIQEQTLDWELPASSSPDQGWMTVPIDPSLLQEPIDLRVLLSLNHCEDPTEPSCGPTPADISPLFIVDALRVRTT